MVKKLLFLLFIFASISAKAQLNASDKQQLSSLLEKRINKLRIDLGKSPLKRDLDLAKAAQLQSNYTAAKGKLSHSQDTLPFETPKKRVSHFTKKFGAVGENVLYSKPIRATIAAKSLEKLAFDMYRSWKNSPGHYANMISSSYTHGDFGFTYDPKTKRVHAAQVFGEKGYIIPGQLSKNAFNIAEGGDGCSDFVSNKLNIITKLGNGIYLRNNQIYFAYHNVSGLRELMVNPDDGFAIDLVSRDQLRCGQDNQLDISPIYDGILLPPVFRDELFSKNEAQGGYRFIASLGNIPEAFVDTEFSANIVFIKSGEKCGYSVPTKISHKQYELRPVEPVLHDPNVNLKTTGVNTVHEISFEFDSGKVTPTKDPTINFSLGKLFEVEVNSYTSVDGSAQNNKRLHENRANYIERFVRNLISEEKVSIRKKAKENWDLCDYQLELLGLEDLRVADKPTIKRYIVKQKDAFWKTALQEQRKSNALLYEYGTWTQENELHHYYNFIDGLLTQNSDQVNKALVAMYHGDVFYDFLADDYLMERLIEDEALVQNISALLLKDLPAHSLDKVVFYIRNWLSKPELLSEGAQKNLLNLYTITSKSMLRYWDTNSTNLSLVMHPKKLEPLFENYRSEDVVNPIFLNFHMASIDYYGQINYSPKINESFYFIVEYFKSQSLTLEDDIALSLFFNHWSTYSYSIELLRKSFETGKINEEGLFILAETTTAYPYNTNMSQRAKIHNKAIVLNKEKWCSWMNTNFQNLREDDLKDLYCGNCK